MPSRAADPLLRLGTFDVAPYGSKDENGIKHGAYYDVLNSVVSHTGLRYQNEVYPPARLYVLLQRHALDLAISSRSLDRDFKLINLGKIWQMQGLLVYRADSAIAPRTLADFSSMLIGRLGATCPPLERAHLRLYDMNDFGQGYRMLAAGRIDAVCGDSGGLGVAWQAQDHAHQPTIKTFPFLTSDVWVFANPDLPQETLARLRDAIHTSIDNGEVSRILRDEIPLLPTDEGAKP